MLDVVCGMFSFGHESHSVANLAAKLAGLSFIALKIVPMVPPGGIPTFGLDKLKRAASLTSSVCWRDPTYACTLTETT